MNLENKTLKSAAEIAAEGKTELESNLDEKTPDNTISSEEIEANKNYDEKIEKQRVEDLRDLRGSIKLPQPESESANPEKEALDRERDIFDQSIESGDLASAEAKLMELKEQIKTRELDHKSRKLSKDAKEAGNWEIAVHMVPLASDKAGRLGRAKALPAEIQKQYADALRLYLETSEPSTSENNLETMDKTKTSYFNELIKQGLYPEGEAWVLENKDGKYAGNKDWLDHVTLPLYRNYRDNGDFEGAQRMIDILPDEPTNENESNTPKKGRIKNLKDIMTSTEVIDPLVAEKEAMREAMAEDKAMPDIPETEARKKEVDDLWGDVFEKVEKEKKEAEALDDSDFIEAFDNNDFVTAGKWLFANKTKINHSGGQEFLDRASRKLFEELLKSGNLDLAASMISINDNDKARQDMRLKLKQTK